MAFALLLSLTSPAWCINIVVDYTYDTNGFFNAMGSKAAMQAAADRFSRVITSSLDAVGPGATGTGTPADWRIGFTHPGTGADWQVSTAANSGSDQLIGAGAGAANVYGFGGLNQDEWILYAGGRSLMSAGVGGTGTGTNFTSTFNDFNGPMHRGRIANTPSNTVNDLPVWGGSISFDTGRNWHFDLSTTAGAGEVDFYSIALHEIGHALGLSTSWNQWTDDEDVTETKFEGANAVAAYNADNGTSLTSLNLVSDMNDHWEDQAYDSKIFQGGSPITVGTVGTGFQDLLMEPVANFSGSQERFELTNVDVAALRDIGWATVPEPSTMVLSLLGLAFFGAYVGFRRRKGTAALAA